MLTTVRILNVFRCTSLAAKSKLVSNYGSKWQKLVLLLFPKELSLSTEHHEANCDEAIQF